MKTPEKMLIYVTLFTYSSIKTLVLIGFWGRLSILSAIMYLLLGEAVPAFASKDVDRDAVMGSPLGMNPQTQLIDN